MNFLYFSIGAIVLSAIAMSIDNSIHRRPDFNWISPLYMDYPILNIIFIIMNLFAFCASFILFFDIAWYWRALMLIPGLLVWLILSIRVGDGIAANMSLPYRQRSGLPIWLISIGAVVCAVIAISVK